MFHDSDSPQVKFGSVVNPNGRKFVPHLNDDVFGLMLSALNDELTDGLLNRHALTVILDSCNSLSATRGSPRSRYSQNLIEQEYDNPYPEWHKVFEDYGLSGLYNRIKGHDTG